MRDISSDAQDSEDVDDEQEQEWYLMRLESGLSTLQTADIILGWVCMEDDGVSLTEWLKTLTGRSCRTSTRFWRARACPCAMSLRF